MRRLTFFLLLFIIPLSISAQIDISGKNSIDYLVKNFPKLTHLYRSDLENCHTHYIFAVDVSGSMNKYDNIVTPSLRAFIQALPVGEQISVIPFGTEAEENKPGLCIKIHDEGQKGVLLTALTTLYINDGYSKEFKANTNIKNAIEAVNKVMRNNQDSMIRMNVVVIITDFLNDLPQIGEQKLKSSDLKDLNKHFDNVTFDKYTRVVAMQLPKSGTGAGYCLNQLQKEVFCNTSSTRKFDIINVINDQSAIAHWFEQLSRDIMTEKLRAVIQLDNERNLHPSLKTKIDIDGNTVADIHWNSNKLYRQIRIEATKTDPNSDYVFKNNEKVWQTTRDTVLLHIKLGKLANKKIGFRHFNEKLNIGLSLPTPYDNELKKLSIDKPIQTSSDIKSGWLFTFILPFWLTITIFFLLIFYFIAVIKSFLRNKRERFVGNIDLFDNVNVMIGTSRHINLPPSKNLIIGKNGTQGCALPGAEWSVQLVKKCPSPFKFWKRPAFEWSRKDGYVVLGKNKTRGKVGRYNKSGEPSSCRLSCGPNRSEITNGVKISISNKNK